MKFQKIPKNILVLATHGSDAIPHCAKKQLHPDFDQRLQKNFSDFATKSLLKNFPASQTACPKFGRLVGDTNRCQFATDLFRETDFNGNKIWKKPLSKKQKNKYLNLSRQAYLDSIIAKLENTLKNTPAQEPIIILDLHDTGNTMLGKNKAEDKVRTEFTMPTAIFSNKNHTTSNKQLVEKMAHTFAQTFGESTEKIHTNHIFQGGFVTQFFGGKKANPTLKKLLKKYKRSQNSLQVVQCELNRSLYLDETHQKIRPEIGRIRRNFYQFLSQLTNLK